MGIMTPFGLVAKTALGGNDSEARKFLGGTSRKNILRWGNTRMTQKHYFINYSRRFSRAQLAMSIGFLFEKKNRKKLSDNYWKNTYVQHVSLNSLVNVIREILFDSTVLISLKELYDLI